MPADSRRITVPLKALVAPDSFKGTVSATEAAGCIASGLGKSGWDCETLPVADGGEGTLDVIAGKLGLNLISADVTGPAGETVSARYGLSRDRKLAVVEMAEACGLELVRPRMRNPVKATSRGVGELISCAVDSGANRVVVSAGGSATCDGGRGTLEALGASFGRQNVELKDVEEHLRGVKLEISCDVNNPFTGSNGSARVFAPQKGADPEDVERLERRLVHLARLAERSTGNDPSDVTMAGAGGGLAGGLWAFAGAELKPGAPLVLEILELDTALDNARFVVTGEGRLDNQTLAGKAPAEVAITARQRGVPCHAIVGQSLLDRFSLRRLDLGYVYEAPAKSPSSAKRQLTAAAHNLGLKLAEDYYQSS